MNKQILKQQGFSLVLVILIMVGMLAASLAISNIVLRSSRSISKVSDSEIAYYAAETAAEKILYKINKEYIDISSFVLPVGTLESGAEYDQISIEAERSGSFSKLLASGESLQLDLDLNGVDYPNSLDILGSGRLLGVVLSGGEDPQTENLIDEILPFNLSLIDSKYYKLRIFNNTSSDVEYTINPSSDLPIGAVIKTKGTYKDTERQVETKDLKWQIYKVAVTVPSCGNGVKEAGEECDGDDDEACSGLCQEDCTCREIVWTCGDTITYAGQIYNTVQIGTQCWFKENLNIGTRITSCDGGYVGVCSNAIPAQTPQDQGASCSSIEKYCYNDDEANCNSDGALYQWNQAMCGSTLAGTQGICPDEWHVPTDAEWCVLEQTVDSSITCDSVGWRGTDGGTKLKQGGSSGFDAPLAGGRQIIGWFNSRGSSAWLWSSSESGSNAWYRDLYWNDSRVKRVNFNKQIGFSIRCLRD